VKLTTHLHLVPRSKNERSCTSTPSIRLHGVKLRKKAQGQLYLYIRRLRQNTFHRKQQRNRVYSPCPNYPNRDKAPRILNLDTRCMGMTSFMLQSLQSPVPTEKMVGRAPEQHRRDNSNEKTALQRTELGMQPAKCHFTY
jgi:hypothetical protein